jgi:hypothetical protein
MKSVVIPLWMPLAVTVRRFDQMASNAAQADLTAADNACIAPEAAFRTALATATHGGTWRSVEQIYRLRYIAAVQDITNSFRVTALCVETEGDFEYLSDES